MVKHHLTLCHSAAQVPWDDLRYIFGEIMYGGHIVEDWDRRLCSAYLAKYFQEPLLEGFEMFPGFFTPPNTSSHKQVGTCLACVTRLHNACDIGRLILSVVGFARTTTRMTLLVGPGSGRF